MKRLLTLLLTSILALGLAACNTKEDEHEMHADTDEVYPLEVELTVPKDIVTDEEVEFRAYVSMNNEPLEADRVQFEVKKDEESLGMLDGEYEEEGNYTVNYTFKEKGTYQVIAHTDAKDQHTMPVEEVEVK